MPNIRKDEAPLDVNDTWILFLVYPIMALLTIHIGNDNTFLELVKIPSYYTDLLLAFFCIYLLAFYNRALFKKINERWNWTTQWKNRVAHHLVYGITLPVMVIITLEGLYLTLLLHIPLSESSMAYLELPVISIFCTLVNLLYAILYFRKHNLHLSQQLAQQWPGSIDGDSDHKSNFVVNNGIRSLNIPAEDVAYFKVMEKSTILVTKKSQQYLYDSSLEQLMQGVNQKDFFQLNRQLVASRTSIKAYSPTETRKLSVILTPEVMEDIYVSKTKATSFLQWLKQQ